MKVADPKYSFKIVEKQCHTRGEVFCIDLDGSLTRILYTHHALGRIKQWGILPETIAETLLFAEEFVLGHRGRFIAHKRYGNNLIGGKGDTMRHHVPLSPGKKDAAKR
jgi:hypothetical protein